MRKNKRARIESATRPKMERRGRNRTATSQLVVGRTARCAIAALKDTFSTHSTYAIISAMGCQRLSSPQNQPTNGSLNGKKTLALIKRNREVAFMGVWGDGVRSPWLYAADILALRTRDERVAAIEQVPAHVRELVRAQVVNDAWVVGNWARRVNAGLPVYRVPRAVLTAAEYMGIDLAGTAGNRGLIIRLSDADVELAKLIGRQRSEISIRAGTRNKQLDNTRDNVAIHIEGFAGELAVCRALNIAPDLNIRVQRGGYDAIWNGLRLDVKATRHATGRLMVYVPRHGENGYDDIDAFVLARLHRYPVVEIPGYALKHEIMRLECLEDVGYGPTYFLADGHLRRFPKLSDER